MSSAAKAKFIEWLASWYLTLCHLVRENKRDFEQLQPFLEQFQRGLQLFQDGVAVHIRIEAGTRFVGKRVLTLIPISVSGFYLKRERMSPWTDFQESVLTVARELQEPKTIQTEWLDITEDDLPERANTISGLSEFDPDTLCAYLARLIEEQRSGEPGDLAVEDGGNNFWMGIPDDQEVVLVNLSWRKEGVHPDPKGWNLMARKVSDKRSVRFYAGDRWFSLLEPLL